MNDVTGYGKRIRRALRVWASQFEQATYADFGRRVAEIEKRDPAKGPYTTSAVSEWLQDRSEPKIATFRAIEVLTGFRAAWLMLGELPERSDEREGGGNQPATSPLQIAPTGPRIESGADLRRELGEPEPAASEEQAIAGDAAPRGRGRRAAPGPTKPGRRGRSPR